MLSVATRSACWTAAETPPLISPSGTTRKWSLRRRLRFSYCLQFTFSGQVYWRIMGPNNPLQILEATNDISMVSGNKEVTTGSLLWNDGESGEKSFVLDLKPFSSWEVEKTFLVEIYNIQGSPSEAGSGEISISQWNCSI